MYTNTYYGPTFGGGHDIYIANNAGSYSNSNTNFRYVYKLPSGYSYGSTKAKNLLAGSYRFSPNEVEVFYFSAPILQDSSIIKNKKWVEKLEEWLPSNLHGKLTERCYKASVNGWTGSTFHSRCDSKGPTLVIIKSGSYVFGGFASQSWGGNSRYMRAANSFIFSFKNKDGLAPFKSNTSNNAYAMYTNRYYGPIFGYGFDIYIANNAGSSSSSYTNFGYGYKLPSGYSAGNSKTRNLLPGSYRFTPNELEVYYFSTPILQDSSILKDKKRWIGKLQQWLPSYLNDKKTVRCYQATKNGW
ncbi:uncharacterized protein LOC124445538 [Xenia sp. Carnegie-2017]|uniref:uncharacterized protein LOC124445538 n=1 Tax=Xenia sp. Carnegie-2017 TaxID=2897299 RepID=UPI001F03A7FD|nr:uncharacterized protein LOC124445538 [Xenia sp. Carnegie-2017]